MKNFTQSRPSGCTDTDHDFQLRSIWTDTYVSLISLGTGVQVVSKVLPFEYRHCKHCHWKELRTIIDKSTQTDSNTGLLVSREIFVYSGVEGEKEAITQMVENLRDFTKEYMERILSQ